MWTSTRALILSHYRLPIEVVQDQARDLSALGKLHGSNHVKAAVRTPLLRFRDEPAIDKYVQRVGVALVERSAWSSSHSPNEILLIDRKPPHALPIVGFVPKMRS